jgi:hypothetical protein
MDPASAIAAAATFVWLGMVLAISFLEAPLKFRAPGITVPLGLGIGRLVFRALNGCELVLAAVVAAMLIIRGTDAPALTALVIAIVILLAQVLLVRPRLSKRTDAVLAGAETPRSRMHLAYLALEMIKVVALVIGGIFMLAGGGRF